MLVVAKLAARGWPAAETARVDGWLLRHTPSLSRRRSNSALPVGAAHGDPALVEDFYARRGGRALVQVAPAEAWASLACEERPDAGEHAREVLARIEPATAYARKLARLSLPGGAPLRGAH
jgi:hypothetical protein